MPSVTSPIAPAGAPRSKAHQRTNPFVLVASGLAELLWPTRCAGCDVPGAVLCDECLELMPRIDQALACPWCGAPYGRLSCTQCDPARQDWAERVEGTLAPRRDAAHAPVPPEAPFPFERAVCACEYRDVASRVVRAYKDAGERRLAPVMAREMARAVPPDWLSWADALCFVPATKQARRRRGFDHMELVAADLAGIVGTPLVPALVRGAALDQRALGREARAANASGFGLTDWTGQSAGLRPKSHVLLIDDVLTTGATLAAASEALLAAGVQSVRALTFCRVW